MADEFAFGQIDENAHAMMDQGLQLWRGHKEQHVSLSKTMHYFFSAMRTSYTKLKGLKKAGSFIFNQ